MPGPRNLRLGSHLIDPPFTIPSGIVTVNPAICSHIAATVPLGLITTKSIGLTPFPGYPEPIVSGCEDGSLSTAVGLSTMGAAAWAEEMARHYPLAGRFLLTSVFARNVEEFVAVARLVLPVSDGLELNFCCPHSLEFGESVARIRPMTVQITSAVRQLTGKPLVVKLTPNLDDIGGWAAQLVDAGADAIAAIGPTTATTIRDPSTGEPVLSYGKGGLTGPAILQRGLEAVKAIRQAVAVPIIAGGGIRTGSDVRAYRQAGGDIFAVGTAVAGMDSEVMSGYFAALGRDLAHGGDEAAAMLRNRPQILVHRPFTVAAVESAGDQVALTMAEDMPAEPGQFIFAWIPGVGEKPFSLAGDRPVRLGLRAVGPVSRAIASLRPGDRLLLRGPFGRPFPAWTRPLLVAGGTGSVPIRFLASRLPGCRIILGGRSADRLLFRSDLAACGRLMVATDDGSAGLRGTVVDAIDQLAHEEDLAGTTCIVCGPEPMMAAVAGRARRFTSADRIIACVERHTACGIGICGKCSLDGYRTCVDGPGLHASTLAADGEFGRSHRLPTGALAPLAGHRHASAAASNR